MDIGEVWSSFLDSGDVCCSSLDTGNWCLINWQDAGQIERIAIRSCRLKVSVLQYQILLFIRKKKQNPFICLHSWNSPRLTRPFKGHSDMVSCSWSSINQRLLSIKVKLKFCGQFIDTISYQLWWLDDTYMLFLLQLQTMNHNSCHPHWNVCLLIFSTASKMF